MNLHPLELTESPMYPTREEFLVQQNILLEHVPARWSKTKGFLGTVALFVAASCCAGCGTAAHPLADEGLLLTNNNRLIENASSWTRSIFAQKWVGLGCIAMTPPKYTTEDAVKNT